ncbi:MAG: emopamil-binding family protein [Actinomycetota bacterium]|nr:emopamil-binding family protein [Actinomycetota bacterium]
MRCNVDEGLEENLLNSEVTAQRAAGEIKPLKERKIDVAILIFFFVNILFITYIVDLEQLVIANPYHYKQPIWPPSIFLSVIHSYGKTYDPLLMARPVWWKATIWIDALFFGPFYLFGIYSFIKGRKWIRIPAIIYSSVMMTNVVIILSEEIWGPHASPHLYFVLLDNAPWLIFPILIITRMYRFDDPFAYRG